MKNETRKEQKKDTKKPEVRTRAVEELRLNKFISHNSNYSRREADAESSHAELYLKLLVELPRDDISNDLRSNT